MGKARRKYLIQNNKRLYRIDVFTKPDSTHEEIVKAGEMFLLKLYGVHIVQTLNKHMHIIQQSCNLFIPIDLI